MAHANGNGKSFIGGKESLKEFIFLNSHYNPGFVVI